MMHLPKMIYCKASHKEGLLAFFPLRSQSKPPISLEFLFQYMWTLCMCLYIWRMHGSHFGFRHHHLTLGDESIFSICPLISSFISTFFMFFQYSQCNFSAYLAPCISVLRICCSYFISLLNILFYGR